MTDHLCAMECVPAQPLSLFVVGVTSPRVGPVTCSNMSSGRQITQPP